MKPLYSRSPEGESFPLPQEEDYDKEYERLQATVQDQREQGKEIILVLSLGYVGAVMAAVVADAEDENGVSNKFVIGVQRPSVRSFRKIPLINQGVTPISTEDPSVAELTHRCVKERKNFIATYIEDALKLADVVVVDIQCDFVKESLGRVETGTVDMEALELAFEVIGKKIAPHCLVLIETTVAPGTTEQIAYPIIRKEFRRREIQEDPLLAHSFARIMPGKNYVNSVRNFWRACSGMNEESKQRVVQFLTDVINTDEYPLTVLDRPVESETAKIIEKQLPRHDPGVHGRVDTVRGEKRGGYHQGHQGHQGPAHPS